MKVLLTNHHLVDFQGSEIFTYTIADFLTRRGCEVLAYSRHIGQAASLFKDINVPVVNHLEEIKDEKFDVAHVHHNINAMEVRYHFPSLPMIFVSHGVLPFLEQPPAIDLGIARYLAVSEGVKNNLIEKGVEEDKIEIFHNMVDPQKYRPASEIHDEPRKALILSNKIDDKTENIIREACGRLGIECQFIGIRFGQINYSLVPSYINESDIVFSLGRGAIEAMMCGRVPIVFDYRGGDGMVTPENMTEIMKHNFSGRRYGIEYTADQLALEIQRYDKRYGRDLREIANEHFSADKQADVLIGIYGRAAKNGPIENDKVQGSLLPTFIHTIEEVRNYTHHVLTKNFNAQISLRDDQLRQAELRAQGLKGAIHELKAELSLRDDQLHQAELGAQSLKGTIDELNRHISLQNDQIVKEKTHTDSLEEELQRMRRSVSWQFGMKISRFAARAFPRSSIRRRLYDFGLKCGGILLADGWKGFLPGLRNGEVWGWRASVQAVTGSGLRPLEG
ncbi:MAG: hypothetical protein EHM36_06755, partial [Deltaproteobacteria bacterium]